MAGHSAHWVSRRHDMVGCKISVFAAEWMALMDSLELLTTGIHWWDDSRPNLTTRISVISALALRVTTYGGRHERK